MKKQTFFLLILTFLSLSTTVNGQDNTVVGENAFLHGTLDAHKNCAFGFWALYDDAFGDNNTAMGSYSMVANKTGSSNTAVGFQSLNGNIGGNYNTAIGMASMLGGASDLNVNNNSAVGYESLMLNKTNDNNAFGYRSQRNNLTGFNNAAFGTSALEKNSAGSYNAAFGNFSLYKNKANSNSAFGYYSAFYNDSGVNNCAFGANALTYNVSGNLNVAVGIQALLYGAKSNNVGLGSFAGINAVDANNCTLLGYFTDVIDSKLVYSNSTALGNNARITASNQVSVGNAAITSIGGFTNWTNFSDGRYKTDVSEDVPGLEFINKLRPVTYHLNVNGIARYLNEDPLDSLNAAEYPVMLSMANQARDTKAKQLETGFIAQEVEEAAMSLGYEFSGVDRPQNETDLYGLRYAAFTVPLVKAVQELDQENQTLKTQLRELQCQNAEMLKRFEALEVMMAESGAIQRESLTNTATLNQNVPNPFSQNTVIQITAPEQATRVTLLITNETGSVVKEITISERGSVTVNLSASTLNSGVYFYTLIVDGQKVDTRKMILMK